jgi:hypothetical protein
LRHDPNSFLHAYRATIEEFQHYVRFRLSDRGPDELVAADALASAQPPGRAAMEAAWP